MKHGLKCSRCGNHNAEKRWGYNPETGRQYHNKHCFTCGNNTPKVYYGEIMTQEEYSRKMDEFHQRVTEMLEANKVKEEIK